MKEQTREQIPAGQKGITVALVPNVELLLEEIDDVLTEAAAA